MRQIAVQKVDIVWFKRDLRVQDHAPLEAASQTGNSVLPLYVVEDDYWAQPFASERHWLFLEACLIELLISQQIARCHDDEDLMRALLKSLGAILKSSPRN